MARERSEPRRHFWRILFERSERSERSELCAGPWTRAPQGSRSEAEAASSARRAAPGQPFAATALRLPIDASCVRNWPVRAAHQRQLPGSQLAQISTLQVIAGRWKSLRFGSVADPTDHFPGVQGERSNLLSSDRGLEDQEWAHLRGGGRQALFPPNRCDQWEWSLSGREWSLSRCWAAARLCFSVPPDTGVVSVRAICSSIAMREGSRLQASAPLLRCPGCSRRPHVGQAGAAAPGLHEEGCRGSPHGSVGPVGTIPLAQHDTTLFKGLTASAHCLHGSRNRDIGSRLTGMRWLRACADDPGKARSKTASLARGWKLNRMRMLRHLVGCSLRAQRGSQPSALACRLCTYRRAAVSVTAVVSG